MKPITSVSKKKNQEKRSQQVSNKRRKTKGEKTKGKKIKNQHIEDLKVNFKGIFGSSFHEFSLHFGEKTFWWAKRENICAPLFIFLPFYLTKHTLKKFSFLFSLQSFSSSLFHLQTNTP